jgi:NAD(P)-dependent dehydrogenase (short-subunit alcohol dehydrogenase family)
VSPLAIDLAGRRAIVTGAGKGIGRAICLELARAGADVFGVSRTADELSALGEEVAALGVRYACWAADLRAPGAPAELARRAEAALGPVDVLVNNAGLAVNAPAELVTEEDWDLTLDVNLKAAFFCAQAVGRAMLERGRGRIVNVTSQSGVVALQDHAAYCASKAGLGMITKVLAVEWGPRGVTVNAVAPTVILTPLGERVWGDPARGGPMLARIPLGRFGVPSEVASVVAFLASDLAALINGETIMVDGGYTAQ